ncbi:MAG: hypothetical protein HGA63_10350 [Syntrophobacteraceae bacterium]|nr:hypothetical protein [Syntrophobacteraceae bacterium]
MNQLQEQEAKIRKLLADAQLVLEKVETERQNREMAVAGTEIEQAKFAEDQRDRRYNRNLSTFKALQEADSKAQPSKSKH